jgi:NAD(P)-dependent dehydrogenase (short-subunit alcohol dehydrogenase family)
MHEVKELQAQGVDASEAAMKAMQGRMCEPEEVAQAALWLASDDSSFVSGSAIYVDNGFTAI